MKRISAKATLTRNQSLWEQLGPGLITGAADDDPSGIATCSQVGAAFGYGLLWTALFTWPLMVGIQMVCARIGRVSGSGIEAADRRPGAALRRAVRRCVVAVAGVRAVPALCPVSESADSGTVRIRRDGFRRQGAVDTGPVSDLDSRGDLERALRRGNRRGIRHHASARRPLRVLPVRGGYHRYGSAGGSALGDARRRRAASTPSLRSQHCSESR